MNNPYHSLFAKDTARICYQGRGEVSSVLGTQTANRTQSSLYTVLLKIQSAENTPVSNASVLLKAVSANNNQQGKTDTTGTVRFANLQSSIYDATIMVNNAKAGENIINVSGQNHILTLGINLKAEQKNPLLKNTSSLLKALSTSPLLIAGIAIIGVIAGTVLTIVFMRLKENRKILA